MASLNKVSLIGHLGRDPESRYLPNGDAVVTLSVATSESWKDKQSGEKKEKTAWHRIILYRQLAEIATKYCQKGSQVYLEGRIEYREYEKEGQKHYITEIVGHELKMLGRPNGAVRQQEELPLPQEAPKKPKPADDFEDDIPF
jgi:single-strand DNA-binding protein